MVQCVHVLDYIAITVRRLNCMCVTKDCRLVELEQVSRT